MSCSGESIAYYLGDTFLNLCIFLNCSKTWKYSSGCDWLIYLTFSVRRFHRPADKHWPCAYSRISYMFWKAGYTMGLNPLGLVELSLTISLAGLTYCLWLKLALFCSKDSGQIHRQVILSKRAEHAAHQWLSITQLHILTACSKCKVAYNYHRQAITSACDC